MGAPDLAAYFHYLDKLNQLAITNMGRAALYLEARFLIERAEAEEILQEWIKRFVPPSTPARHGDTLERHAGE